MNTDLLRTFLEVERTRHFARAAHNLYVTQAAVSARIRQLEALTGQRLFSRERNNIQLTPAGHRLVPYAESILAAWDRALLESAGGNRPLVVIGCLPSLREIYLDDWLLTRFDELHGWLLQVESLNTIETITRVRERSVGIGIVYEPPRAPDLWAEALTRVDLTLVATRAGVGLADLPGYIHIDWGPSFAIAHDALSGLVASRLRLDSPLLALRALRAHGGSAYLPGPLIAVDLQQGVLHAVPDAPIISRDVYLIGSEASDASDGARAIAAALHAYAGPAQLPGASSARSRGGRDRPTMS
jgi:DNA-binding transcriptional LysR family regulator